jgi:hypothetical protein
MINRFRLNKINLTVLFLLFFSFASNAQISFDKNDFKNPFVDKMNFDYSVKAYLSNNSINPDDTIFEWRVIDLDQPSEWELQVCTNGECIADPPVERTHPFILTIGQQLEFKIGWALFESSGNGLVELVVNSTMYPDNVDTVTLEIATLASIKDRNKTNISVNPNPINDYMSVEFPDNSIKTLMVYDILGNIVLTQQVFSGERINTSALMKGVYILKVDGLTDFSKIIHKN